MLGRYVRTTTDIDLVPLASESGKSGNAQVLESFELAESLKVPIESINTAAMHFLKKIPNFEKELIVMHSWKKGRIFRPSLYLYFQLKLGRLSESDELDCAEMLKLNLPETNLEELKRIFKFTKKAKAKFKKDQLLRVENLIQAIQERMEQLSLSISKNRIKDHLRNGYT